MILDIEPFLEELCGQLNWTYVGIKRDLDQVIELLRDEESLEAEQDAVCLALAEDNSIVFRLADNQSVPAFVENFEALSGQSRYYVGSLFLVASRPLAFSVLATLSSYLLSARHEGTRIGLSHCFNKITSSTIYSKIDFFFPINNSFGG